MKQYLEESMAIPEKIYETNGAEETFEVGMRLAKEAKAGDIYCLDGDLGTGKTCFFPGLCRRSWHKRGSKQSNFYNRM